MRRKKNTVIAAGLSLVLACSVVGCGDGKKMEAEINPDTPVEEVAFPLKEKAETVIYYQCAGNFYTRSKSKRDLQKTGETDERTY